MNVLVINYVDGANKKKISFKSNYSLPQGCFVGESKIIGYIKVDRKKLEYKKPMHDKARYESILNKNLDRYKKNSFDIVERISKKEYKKSLKHEEASMHCDLYIPIKFIFDGKKWTLKNNISIDNTVRRPKNGVFFEEYKSDKEVVADFLQRCGY